MQNDILENIVTDWNRVNGGKPIENLVNATVASFDLIQPQKSIPQLVQIYKTVKALPDSYWKTQKIKEVQQLIEQASGLFLDAVTNQAFAAQTDSIQIAFTINNRLSNTVKLNAVTLEKWDTTLNSVLASNKNVNFSKKILVPADKAITQPYWLANKMEEGYYTVSDQQQIGEADVQAAYKALFKMNIEGEDFVFERPVKYKSTDPVKGELYQPFIVLPRMELNYVNANNLSINGDGVKVPVHFSSNRSDSAVYKVAYIHSKNWTADNNFLNYATFKNKSNYSTSILKPVQKDISLKEEAKLTAVDEKGRIYDQYRQTINYDHIPSITYFSKATANLVTIAVQTVGKRIGYIVGAGDKVPAALEQMGYEVVLLTDKELARNNLQQYDAIISGVRAYNTNVWLSNYYDKLMQYVEQGGNLIVQYNTNNLQGPVRAKIGPYNFTLTNRRITDETAPVTFLKPDHAVLNFPNKITSDDFKDWIQERSIYHATDLDKSFEAILSMQDKGEAPESGSLVIAKYGKGFFTYTGLVFFRELPAGVPGAYRLMANLIALNQKKAF
jgi:hypothetical protein